MLSDSLEGWPTRDADLRLEDFNLDLMLWHARWESAYMLGLIRSELGLPLLSSDKLIPPLRLRSS
jgi:hypothetical protein